jgi:molybdopterin synthase catalytic subunit
MKVIQIVGAHANTGKTTFGTALLERLSTMGTVGAVKHLGGHLYDLPAGKDTTLYYEHGAAFTVGIDRDKAMVAIRNAGLEEILRILCDAGVDYAVVEGFKQHPLPKIVMGDLVIEHCVLRNPGVEEVIEHLDAFEEFVTLQGLVHELKKRHDTSRAGAVLTFNGIVRAYTGGERTEYMDSDDHIGEKLRAITEEIESIEGILGVRFHHHRGRLYAGEDITYLAILAEHRQEAFEAAGRAIDRLRRQLHDAETGAGEE